MLLKLLTLSNALVAGTFFAFSTFIMSAFAGSEPQSAARLMQSINVVIVKSPFIALFLLSALLSIALPIHALVTGNRANLPPLLISAAAYLLGVFVVTMAFNVPLNDQLDSTTSFWPRYLAAWMPWNHVRTLASIVATAALLWGNTTKP